MTKIRNRKETRARISQILELLLNGEIAEFNVRREENLVEVKKYKDIERETFKLRERD